MAHVFWVHSHITFLMAEMVIEHFKLSSKSIIILTYRGYTLPRAIKASTIFEVPFYDLKTKEECIEVQNVWKRKLNFNFEFYVPQTREQIIYLIVNIPSCKKYSYIEEGTLSYDYKDSKLKVYSHQLLTFLGLRKRMRMLDYTNKKFKNTFCISSNTFKGCNSKIILTPNFNKTIHFTDNDLFKKCHIIVFDAIVSFNIVSLEESNRLLQLIIDNLKANEVKKVFYKFHPEQLREENNTEVTKIKEILTKNSSISFVELPKELILEELLVVNKQVVIYNYLSSIGIYASALGSTVYSVSDRINPKLIQPLTKKKWNQL